jgi:hypothetical protein
LPGRSLIWCRGPLDLKGHLPLLDRQLLHLGKAIVELLEHLLVKILRLMGDLQLEAIGRAGEFHQDFQGRALSSVGISCQNIVFPPASRFSVASVSGPGASLRRLVVMNGWSEGS